MSQESFSALSMGFRRLSRLKKSLGWLSVLSLVIFASRSADAATLSGTFSGITTSSSTVAGIPVSGSFSIGPQTGSNSPSSGPGYLDYVPDSDTVSISFSSQYGMVTFTNKIKDAQILLGNFGTGIQSLALELDGDTPGTAATLNLNSTSGSLFGNSDPQYSNSLAMTGYAEYLASGMDQGLDLVSLSIDGPLTTPLPPAGLTTVPVPSSWLMMMSGLGVLAGAAFILRRLQIRSLFNPV